MSKEGAQRAKAMLANRQVDYSNTFAGEHGQRVLMDLIEFCFGTKSTFHADPRAHALAEGRREVLLRIQHHLQLSPEEIWNLYRRKDVET